MRTLLKVSMPVEQANKAIKDGNLPKLFKSISDQLRPEATYFYAENGKRTALMIFDLKEPAQIPSIAEPFFMQLNAEVELYPAMDVKDMERGVERARQESQHVLVAA